MLITLKDIRKTYHLGEVDLEVLKGVSFTIERPQMLAIMGTSGSGKSTLMNLLGCLDRPSAGSYELDGREVAHLSRDELAEVRNKNLGFVFQSFNLLSRTTAVENVELPLIYAGVARKERRVRAVEALRQVGLSDRLDHRPNQLSGGQQQRVAIARALVSRPTILLADEPTGNLDSRTSIEIMAMFQALAREGILVVLVTHEPDIAGFADRVVLMRDGVVLSDRMQTPATADVSVFDASSRGVS